MPDLGVQIEGLESTTLKLRRFASRMLVPEPALREGMKILEASEASLFQSYGGKFVKSGTLERSLTQPSAEGAVRQAHGATLEFGTSIWYANFQRKIGGPSGKPRGRKREGPSLVVRAKRGAKTAVREAVREYLLRGTLI